MERWLTMAVAQPSGREWSMVNGVGRLGPGLVPFTILHSPFTTEQSHE